MKAQFPDEQDAGGAFVRQDDAFRDWVKADRSSAFAPEPGRYHLYVSLACPWAHRTIIMRRLKKLEDVIGMTVLDPVRDERGWAFRDGDGFSTDPLNGFKYLSEAYAANDPGYRGRVTVPVLWDTKTRQIVSNSDDDILRMLETEFDAFADNSIDYFPAPHRAEIHQLNEIIYDRVNNGVYKAGFATSQRVYDVCVRMLFEELDRLETRLGARRYLIAENPVETDWRLFVTLIRFDAVYYGHFKCNLRLIMQYPNLSGYVRDLYQFRGVKETVRFDHIKRHYYYTHNDINPTQIVPAGPIQHLDEPPGRDHLS